jgi:hypothetical protein
VGREDDVEDGAGTEELVTQTPWADPGAPAAEGEMEVDLAEIPAAEGVTAVDPRYVDAEADDEDNIIFRGLE